MIHKELNLRQRIGQMFMLTIEGQRIDGSIINLLTQFSPGGIHLTRDNLRQPKQIYQLTKELQHYSNKTHQLFIAVEEAASKGMTIVPSSHQLGKINNRLYTKQAADITGREMKAVGINMNLGTDLTLSSENSNSFSDNITHVAQHGRAMMEGYHKHNIMPVADGFLNHYHVIPDDIPLYKTAIQPYLYAMEHGLEAVKTTNPQLAVPFLRNELGFEGLILYDAPNREDISGEVMKAIDAGVDMVVLDCAYEKQLEIMEEVFQAVYHADLPEPVINQAVNRIADKKRAFKIDEPPAFNPDEFMNKQAKLLVRKLEQLQK